MTELPVGRRERKKAATRQSIADAALRLFLEGDAGVRPGPRPGGGTGRLGAPEPGPAGEEIFDVLTHGWRPPVPRD